MLINKKNISDELQAFAEWCCSYGDEFKIYAWSQNDLSQVKKEMKLKNIARTQAIDLMINNWQDLQLEFDKSLLKDYHTSLSDALDYLGMAFEGRMHDALDDAHNTARLYVSMSTSEDYKNEIDIIKSYLYDEHKHKGATLGDLIDFSKFNFDFN